MTSQIEEKAMEYIQENQSDAYSAFLAGAKALLEEARRWQAPAYGSGEMEVLISILEEFVGGDKNEQK